MVDFDKKTNEKIENKEISINYAIIITAHGGDNGKIEA